MNIYDSAVPRSGALASLNVARLFPNLLSNALEPGWVPTITGGPSAPNDSSAAMPATSAVA
jgi:hypothetical protein